MADPKHPRHYDEAFKRQIVQLYESGKPSRETRPSTTSRDRPCSAGSRHPQQRLHPGRGQPHARAERADRAGEAQQAVGDGGGRFRTSGAGIRTKAGVIRSDAGRCPVSAQCGILALPSRPVTGCSNTPRPSAPTLTRRMWSACGGTAARCTGPGRSSTPGT